MSVQSPCYINLTRQRRHTMQCNRKQASSQEKSLPQPGAQMTAVFSSAETSSRLPLPTSAPLVVSTTPKVSLPFTLAARQKTSVPSQRHPRGHDRSAATCAGLGSCARCRLEGPLDKLLSLSGVADLLRRRALLSGAGNSITKGRRAGCARVGRGGAGRVGQSTCSGVARFDSMHHDVKQPPDRPGTAIQHVNVTQESIQVLSTPQLKQNGPQDSS
jgi:hypothetical protein